MAKKKAAKRAAKKPAAKSGKKISTKAAAQTGESKKPYPAARFTAENLGLHTGFIVSELNPTPRDYSDREKLQKLYAFGIALSRWAARLLRNRSVAAIAAGCMDKDSLTRLAAYTAEQVTEYAPECVSSGTETPDRVPQEAQLDSALQSITQLTTYIDKHLEWHWVPARPFAGEDEALVLEYDYPDRRDAPAVCRSLKLPVSDVKKVVDWQDLPQRVRRVARLASDAVRDLTDHVNSHEQGGFSRSLIEERLQESGDRQLHERFTGAIETLASLASRSDVGQCVDWAFHTQYLQNTYSKWIERCYGPTVQREKTHAKRSERQVKKKTLRRLIASTSQYGLLLQGEAEMARAATVIEILGRAGLRIADATKAFAPEIKKPDSPEVRQLMRALDEKAVTDGDHEYWVRCLGPRAQACGQLAEIIGGQGNLQATSWKPEERFPKLKEAGIFTKTEPEDEFTEIRIRMQEAGIAVQGPWKFIEGKRDEPETKSGVWGKWLLNPMAQILAQHPG